MSSACGGSSIAGAVVLQVADTAGWVADEGQPHAHVRQGTTDSL